MFDDDNVVRAEQGGYGYASWRYVQGPGLDDPLVAVHPIGSSQGKYYYLTDGRGRHLAFTDSTGKNYMEPASVGGPEYTRYYQEGGNQAGSIENSNGFANTRGASDNAPQLSYYRNRYYDQQTGRFINEDPIGIAGGANLYQYSGNNPATFTDPFGLIVEFGGDADAAKRAWQQLVSLAANAARSRNRAIAKAGVALGQILSSIENSKAIVQINFVEGANKADTERRGIWGSTITIDPNYGPRMFGLSNTVELAHELGNAYARIQFGSWASSSERDTRAVKTENLVRTIYACDPRPSHFVDPSACPQ